jgi:hypothetical protein
MQRVAVVCICFFAAFGAMFAVSISHAKMKSGLQIELDTVDRGSKKTREPDKTMIKVDQAGDIIDPACTYVAKELVDFAARQQTSPPITNAAINRHTDRCNKVREQQYRDMGRQLERINRERRDEEDAASNRRMEQLRYETEMNARRQEQRQEEQYRNQVLRNQQFLACQNQCNAIPCDTFCGGGQVIGGQVIGGGCSQNCKRRESCLSSC